MSTKPDDTSLETWRIRQEILGSMNCDARVRSAIDLSEAVREIQLSGLLTRNPTWTRAQAVRQVILKQFGVDVESPT